MLLQMTLLNLLVFSVYCTLGVVFGPEVFGSSTSKCIIQSGYNYLTWMTPSTSSGINKSFTINALQNMKNAGALT